MVRLLYSQRGSALLTSLIIGMIVVAGLVTQAFWNWNRTQATTYQVAARHAMAAAETGINEAMLRLRSASLNLPIGGHTHFDGVTDRGRFSVSVSRTHADANLLEAYSTGYFYLDKGLSVDEVDEHTRRKASMAVVQARINFFNVSDFMAAVPGRLNIGYGSDIRNGSVYAEDLVFEPRGTAPPDPTQIGAAYYVNSVRNDVSSDVNFTSAPAHAQRLPVALALSALGPAMSAYYWNKITNPLQQRLPQGVPFTGSRSAPDAPAHVYFADGDLRIGSGSHLMVDGVYVIYVQGQVFIDGPIRLANPQKSWIAILAERDIRISDTAPHNLDLTGTFVTDGRLIAEGSMRPSHARLQITGGFVAHGGVSLSNVWRDNRTYVFKRSTDPALLLPNITVKIDSHVLRGRYN